MDIQAMVSKSLQDKPSCIVPVKDTQIFQSICYYNAYAFKTEAAV